MNLELNSNAIHREIFNRFDKTCFDYAEYQFVLLGPMLRSELQIT
jgi:hypothetical protein